MDIQEDEANEFACAELQTALEAERVENARLHELVSSQPFSVSEITYLKENQKGFALEAEALGSEIRSLEEQQRRLTLETDARHSELKDISFTITSQFDLLKLVKNFSCVFDDGECSFHMADRRNRLLEKSIAGDSVMLEQTLDFKNDIEPFVSDKSEALIAKIQAVQQTFNSLEQRIVEADLEQRRWEESNRALRKKSTAKLNHDYKSQQTIDLVAQVAQLEETLESLSA